MEKEIDSFVGKVFKISDSHAIVIPARNMEFSGLKAGDMMKVWYKKQGEE